MTEDRNKWRKYVRGVANPRIEDGHRTEQNSYCLCKTDNGKLLRFIYVSLSVSVYEAELDFSEKKFTDSSTAIAYNAIFSQEVLK